MKKANVDRPRPKQGKGPRSGPAAACRSPVHALAVALGRLIGKQLVATYQAGEPPHARADVAADVRGSKK